MDLIIYTGIAINIIGAIFLGYNALRYSMLFKNAERLTVKMNSHKAQWGRKRAIGFGLMIGGLGIAIVGCLV